jgi:hypothetical protein
MMLFLQKTMFTLYSHFIGCAFNAPNKLIFGPGWAGLVGPGFYLGP